MKRISLVLVLLAFALCSAAFAEPRAGLFRNAAFTETEDTAAPISLVGFFHGHRGGGYGADCGCDVAAPSCGVEASCVAEPTCGAAPSCGCESGWDDYCSTKRKRHHCGLFHKHRRNCGYEASCGCEVSAPTCGYEVSAPACGCESAPACGCGHRHHFGHRHGCGHGGCHYGCGRCGHVCKPIRHWANGWCGQVADGLYGGNPPDCIGGAVAHPAEGDFENGKQLPPEPMPMDEPTPASPQSTRRPLLPGFSSLPFRSVR